MTNLFTYGSLMFKEVIYQLTARQDYKSTKGILNGYARKNVKGHVYPGIYKSQEHKVEGVLYLQVTSADIELLNQFQSNEYVPTEVNIETSEGSFKAIAYVYADPSKLSEADWNEQQFKNHHKEQFARQRANRQKQ